MHNLKYFIGLGFKTGHLHGGTISRMCEGELYTPSSLYVLHPVHFLNKTLNGAYTINK